MLPVQPLPTLLAIDDDASSLQLLESALSSEFNLIRASRGEEGLELARTRCPDLILLDILMPGIDGFETCRRLKADPELQKIPVIFITSSTEEKDEVLGLELGAADYLKRPIIFPVLRQRIRNQLKHQALRKAVDAYYVRLDAVINTLPDMLLEVDRQGVCLCLRARDPELAAALKKAWLGRSLLDGLPLAAAETFRQAIDEADSCGVSYGRIIESGGSDAPRWLELSVAKEGECSGQQARFVILARDVTERRLAEQRLRESEAHYRLLTEDVRDVVWKVNRDLIVTYISPADEALRGYPAQEVIGKHVFEMFSESGIATVTELLRQSLQNAENGIRRGAMNFELEHRCKDGSWIWGEISSKPDYDASGALIGFHGITRDVTLRRQMEDQIRQLAFYDTLTKLPNRWLLNDRLSQTMAASARNGLYAALIFLDLDNFKSLNDTHGHELGDLLLIEAATRIKACVRKLDTVARQGGDEFVVILGGMSPVRSVSKSQAQAVAEKIRARLGALYHLPKVEKDGRGRIVEHRCTASIGITMFRGLDVPASDILRAADTAMYRSKSDRCNGIYFSS